ncbi:hypothetical protein PMAYCL1PPCAC_04848, partial [Pristionchus mayeri]
WSPTKTVILICIQVLIPFIPHLYFLVAPVTWDNEIYKGVDNATGSIYRGVIGAFYVIFSILGVVLNAVAFGKLSQLVSKHSKSSSAQYKQQRALFLYTSATTVTHLIFAVHQFVWSYTFLDHSDYLLGVVRIIRPYVYDLTTFSDPIVLVSLSKPVRVA